MAEPADAPVPPPPGEPQPPPRPADPSRVMRLVLSGAAGAAGIYLAIWACIFLIDYWLNGSQVTSGPDGEPVASRTGLGDFVAGRLGMFGWPFWVFFVCLGLTSVFNGVRAAMAWGKVTMRDGQFWSG